MPWSARGISACAASRCGPGCRVFGWRGFLPRCSEQEYVARMTFDELRKLALAWPEVEDGASYGTPALKVRKKMLVGLREDGDSLVMPGVPPDERAMLVE